jgi:ABC-type multidrug transport system fused ATPase/permease subunit
MFGFQFLASTLDIFALSILGILTFTGLQYLQNQSKVSSNLFVDVFSLDNYNLQTQLIYLSLIIIFLFTFRSFLSLFGLRKMYLFLANESLIMSKKILMNLFRAKPSYVLKKDTQELIYGLSSGVDSLVLGVIANSVVALIESVFLLLIVVVLFLFQPTLAIVTISFFGVALYITQKLLADKARNLAMQQSREVTRFNARLLESIGTYRERLLRGNASWLSKNLLMARSGSLEAKAKLLVFPPATKYIFEFAMILGAGSVAFVQFYLNDSKSAVSYLVLFLAAAVRILPSAARIQGALLALKQNEGLATSILKEVKATVESRKFERNFQNALNLEETFKPSISVSIDVFNYEDREESPILQDIKFTIQPGQFVAIVGESGSGKTTLAKLILGLLDLKHGEILISGQEPLEAIAKWPGQIAYVPQDIYLIDDTILNNILLCDEAKEGDSEQIISILEKMKFDFALEMINYQDRASIGVNGSKLSGGQRQRLAIARALFSNPNLMILDEATSALDSLTEKSVSDILVELKGKTTVIVIAHRLSTVKTADQIILMSKGRISQHGTFEELKATSSLFRDQLSGME